MWVEQPDSKNKTKSSDRTGQYELHFQAAKGQGETELLTQGYLFGLVLNVDGRSWSLNRIQVREGAAFDDVWLFYASPEGASTRSSLRYRDQKPRQANDEEWLLRGSLGRSVVATEARAANGSQYEAGWGVLATDQVEQPVQELIWRKWLDKDDAGSRVKTLPTNKTDALAMFNTYAPDQTTNSFETGGPRLMHRLGASGTDANLLCVSVDIQDDGDLVLRTATFLHRLAGWPNQPYG